MKRRVFQSANETVRLEHYRKTDGSFKYLHFRPGTIFTDKKGKKYQVQANGEWRRIKGENHD